ncbi:hypothetical protein DMA11_21690 [Marinilabiliaceae bacterium JC017]|nr:hypothetical protein DMA11_21690 [Marinilabiliaceae bacterium JC017]
MSKNTDAYLLPGRCRGLTLEMRIFWSGDAGELPHEMRISRLLDAYLNCFRYASQALEMRISQKPRQIRNSEGTKKARILSKPGLLYLL